MDADEDKRTDVPGALRPGYVSADALVAAERAERYRRQLARADVFPSAANWDYIIDHAMYPIARELYRKYLVAWVTDQDVRSDYHDLALARFPDYLRAIPREHAVAAVYSDVESSPDATKALIDDVRLFDAPSLMRILGAGNVVFVADTLLTLQPEYGPKDLQNMASLQHMLDNLPALGEYRESRAIFGSGLRYICPGGHNNPSDTEYCTQCNLNIYGLNPEQSANITAFAARVRLLRSLLQG